MVGRLEPGRRDVAAGRMEPAGVPEVDPVRVASSTSVTERQGSPRSISSASYRPLTVSARACRRGHQVASCCFVGTVPLFQPLAQQPERSARPASSACRPLRMARGPRMPRQREHRGLRITPVGLTMCVVFGGTLLPEQPEQVESASAGASRAASRQAERPPKARAEYDRHGTGITLPLVAPVSHLSRGYDVRDVPTEREYVVTVDAIATGATFTPARLVGRAGPCHGLGDRPGGLRLLSSERQSGAFGRAWHANSVGVPFRQPIRNPDS
jgi:hypothetical protein